MVTRSLRIAVLVCVAAVVWLGAAESRACALLDWLFPRRAEARTTFYAPAAPAAGCLPSQTCYYLPQTSYRVSYQRVPVVTYRPVTACDPCTGAAVTTYRPVLGFTHQASMIPYATYRITYANPCGSVPTVAFGGACAGACAGVSYGAPAASCASGACGSTTTYYPPDPAYSAPTSTYPAPTTTQSGSTTATYPESATTGAQPTAPRTAAPTEATPKTFQEEPAPQGNAGAAPAGDHSAAPSENGDNSPRGGAFDQRLPLYQIPRSRLNSVPTAPGPVNPQNRTASMPVERAPHVQPVAALMSAAAPSSSSLPALPNSVWRASGDRAR